MANNISVKLNKGWTEETLTHINGKAKRTLALVVQIDLGHVFDHGRADLDKRAKCQHRQPVVAWKMMDLKISGLGNHIIITLDKAKADNDGQGGDGD